MTESESALSLRQQQIFPPGEVGQNCEEGLFQLVHFLGFFLRLIRSDNFVCVLTKYLFGKVREFFGLFDDNTVQSVDFFQELAQNFLIYKLFQGEMPTV